MNITYFNHYPIIAERRWERRRFVSQWWGMYAKDRHWVPPYYPALCQALDTGKQILENESAINYAHKLCG